MYVTLTSYNYLESLSYESVASFDLNLNGANSVFEATVSAVEAESNNDVQHISRMFFATADQIILM